MVFFALAALTGILIHKAVNDDSYKTNVGGQKSSRRVMLSSTR